MSLKKVSGYVALFSLIGLFSMSIAILVWAIGQDEVIVRLGEQTEYLYNQSLITNDSLQNVYSIGNAHAGLNTYFDWGYVLIYVIFFLSTIVISYYSREEGYFSFLTNLFFGTMIILFVISLVVTISDWWITDVLYSVVPGIENLLTKFNFIQNNIGILSFIQMLLCIAANRFYFGIKRSFNKIGSEFSDSEELL